MRQAPPDPRRGPCARCRVLAAALTSPVADGEPEGRAPPPARPPPSPPGRGSLSRHRSIPDAGPAGRAALERTGPWCRGAGEAQRGAAGAARQRAGRGREAPEPSRTGRLSAGAVRALGKSASRGGTVRAGRELQALGRSRRGAEAAAGWGWGLWKEGLALQAGERQCERWAGTGQAPVLSRSSSCVCARVPACARWPRNRDAS